MSAVRSLLCPLLWPTSNHYHCSRTVDNSNNNNNNNNNNSKTFFIVVKNKGLKTINVKVINAIELENREENRETGASLAQRHITHH